MEQGGLRPGQALQPPHSVDHTIYKKFLNRPHGRKVVANLVPNVLKRVRVLSWEDDVTGKEAVTDRVETDGRFPLRCLRSCGIGSVRLIRGLLSFARHGSPPPLMFSHRTGTGTWVFN